jgi:hypothetical protein
MGRRACPDVILILKSQGPSTPKQILQIEPCPYGVNHPEANGNFLKFTCRKVQVMIQDKASIKYFKNLP